MEKPTDWKSQVQSERAHAEFLVGTAVATEARRSSQRRFHPKGEPAPHRPRRSPAPNLHWCLDTPSGRELRQVAFTGNRSGLRSVFQTWIKPEALRLPDT